MFDFPNTPTVGQQFTPTGGPTYQWNGTGWTLLGAPTAGMLNQQVFTASGTYTPTPGMQTAIIECVGGGGGGSGTAGVAGNNQFGGGGGSGGYSRKFVTAAQIGSSQTVTIGAAGAGAAAGTNVGGAGGDTSVGTLCVAKGARAGAGANSPGLGGVVGTGDIVAAGNNGNGGAVVTGGLTFQGNGASSIYGGGAAVPGVSGNGNNATNYGSGGSGGFANSVATNYGGGNGSPGLVIITEYANVSVGTATGATSHTGGFINKFRNGMMDVAQRGINGTMTTASGYTLDGWIVAPTGVSVNWSQQYNSSFSGNVLRLNCANGLTNCVVVGRIESTIAVQLLNNNKTAQPITIQFTLYNSTGATITPTIATYFPNSRDNFVGGVTADLATTNLQPIANGAVATIAYTFVPSVSMQLGYQINLGFGGALNNANTALLLDISYADIRATPGLPTGLNNNPPPVEMRPIQQELAFCQRYYYDPAIGGASPIYWYGGYAGVSGALTFTSLLFAQTMRAAPTVVYRNQAYSNASALATSAVNAALLTVNANFSSVGNWTVQFNLTASAEL